MNKTDLNYFKDKLMKEKTLLEEELSTVGKKNPAHPEEWQATVDDSDIDTADENEVADKIGELDDHAAILDQLETQLKEVTNALAKMDKGTYGVCERSGKLIERARLEANPSARTDIEHMKKTS